MSKSSRSGEETSDTYNPSGPSPLANAKAGNQKPNSEECRVLGARSLNQDSDAIPELKDCGRENLSGKTLSLVELLKSLKHDDLVLPV